MSAAAPARAGSRKRLWAVVWRTIGLIFVCLAIAVLIPSNGYLGAAWTDYVIQQAIGGRGFRLAAWETQAIAQKVRDLVTRPGANLTSDEQHDLVVAYFDALGRIDKLAGDIERIYADPKGADPVTLAAPLQAELNDLRAAQAERRPTVEGIIEGQVAAVLKEAGLDDWVQRVAARTVCLHRKPRLPHRLAAGSHRGKERGVPRPGHIGRGHWSGSRDRWRTSLDVSALVDGTGGFSSYPTMVVAYSDLPWVLDTVAHEWEHQTHSNLRPLGWHYGRRGGMRTINETVALIVGDEILPAGRGTLLSGAGCRRPGGRGPLSRCAPRAGERRRAHPHSNMARSCAKHGRKPIACWPRAKSTRPKSYGVPTPILWKTATPSAS